MMKIIKRKKYDTETAESIGDYFNGRGHGDFRRIEEVLYRKTTGEFFLHGIGGPLTRYAKPCGSGCTGGQDIIPLTKDEAMDWVEEHLSAEEFIDIFGEVEE